MICPKCKMPQNGGGLDRCFCHTWPSHLNLRHLSGTKYLQQGAKEGIWDEEFDLGEGFRFLELGERKEAGDEFLHNSTLRWTFVKSTSFGQKHLTYEVPHRRKK